VSKEEGKRPLRRPRQRWEDNSKIDLKETGKGDVNWSDLSHNRHKWRAVVDTLTNVWFSLKKRCEFFLLAVEILASVKGSRSMLLVHWLWNKTFPTNIDVDLLSYFFAIGRIMLYLLLG
jgi:hypothetical protein